MVAGNPPVPLDQTDRCENCNRARELQRRDAFYADRARQYSVILVCKPFFVDLKRPPVITREDWLAWHGRIPPTRTPPQIPEALWNRLVKRIKP